MREMSEEMATLLKSKKMIGDNRAVHEVILADTGYRDFTNPFDDEVVIKKILGSNVTSNPTFSNPIPTNDGRFAFAYCDTTNGEVDIAYCNDESFFYEDYAFNSVINTGLTVVDFSITTGQNKFSLFKRDDNKVLLFISDGGSIEAGCSVNVYISNSGNCDDFIFYSTILSVLPGTQAHYNTGLINVPIQFNTRSGGKRLILSFANGVRYGSDTIGWYHFNALFIYYSDDCGLTWIRSYRYFHEVYRGFTIGQMARLPDGTLICETLINASIVEVVISYDDGITFEVVDYYEGVLGVFEESAYESSYYYDDLSDILYRAAPYGLNANIWCIKNPNGTNTRNVDNWIMLASLDSNSSILTPQIIKLPNNKISITWDDGKGRGVDGKGPRTVILGLDFIETKLQAKNISINRTNGMSSGLNIEFDNKDGILAPDKAGEYEHILWPNKEIIVKQGYGNELIQTYKGLIDTVDMETFPQAISISARDNLKRALDQTVSTILGEHVLTFAGMQVEDMFIALANMAGIPLGIVEETGIAVAEKTFSWETYGDAFSWLSELVGFEVVCDEEGLTHFRKQQIPTTPIISYEFTEGEDIISLGYTINDSDLYRDIIVHGKKTVIIEEKEVDEVIEFKKIFSAADYWGLLPQKILKIDAPEATTLGECEQIALKAEYLMISRARIVRFKSIGIPHLQVGDFIRVTESSTTISEVYRITDLSTNQDSDTYAMDITCYWYSAGGVE